MERQVYNDAYMRLVLNEEAETLELRWKPETAGMFAVDFQRALAVYAVEAYVTKARRLLVDARKFAFSDPGAVEEWRKHTIIPVCEGAGVERLGYTLRRKANLPDGQHDGSIATRYFHTMEDAYDWFND